MSTMIFIYTREYDSEKQEYSEKRSYSIGLADASGKLIDAATGIKLNVKNYCEMCLNNDPICCPVIAKVKNTPKNENEWRILTKEINDRYLTTARIKEFLYSLIPPFDEPFNIELKGGEENE